MKWQFKILTTLFLLIIFNEIIAQQNAYCTHFETERSTYKSAQACYDEIKISSVNQTVVVFEEDNPQFPFELEVSFKGQIDSIHISEFNRDRCRNNISRHRLYDNGQNLDKHQNDNIWTTEIPIRCYNFNTPYRIFSDNLRFKIEISYTENNESKIAEYFFKNQSYAVSQGFLSDVDTTEYHQLNDTIAYSNHIVNVLELTDLAYDYQKYNDRLLSVDLFRESWKSHSDDIVSLVSVNEINCNINNLASADIDRGVIRNSQLFSNTLNHELNHIWFNQNEVVLGFNEHHARYLERATSGFSKEGDCYNGFFNELSFENGKVFAKVIPNEQNTEGTDIINGYNTYFEFNDIELFLMGAVPIDSVQFPIRYIPWRQSLNCTSEIDEGLYQLEDQNSISTISRSEFERATANKRSYGTNSEIDVKFLLITKELISKRELLVLDYIVTLYEELFKRSTQGLGKLNTQIERIVDEDRDGYLSHVDCNDTRSDINPGQTEIAYNNIDDDCNPNTLDDDLDQDGYTFENDCDDLDASINSGQAEIVYNNIDDDCNPNTFDDDLDQDGYTLENDCDDLDPNINPGFEEIPDNTIDENCDGSIDNTTFINEVAGINFSIYPNPTSDILYIEFEHHINVNLKLYSPIQKSYLLHSAEGEINMKELQNGLYILILFDKDSKQVVTRKIVKN